jgi:hypothetical protein
MLVNFEIEMTYILSDSQVAIRSRVELAFSHLKRLIVVDDASIPPAWAAGVYERLFRRSRIVGSCLCISMRSLRVSIPKFVNASTPSSLSP